MRLPGSTITRRACANKSFYPNALVQYVPSEPPPQFTKTTNVHRATRRLRSKYHQTTPPLTKSYNVHPRTPKRLHAADHLHLRPNQGRARKRRHEGGPPPGRRNRSVSSSTASCRSWQLAGVDAWWSCPFWTTPVPICMVQNLEVRTKVINMSSYSTAGMYNPGGRCGECERVHRRVCGEYTDTLYVMKQSGDESAARAEDGAGVYGTPVLCEQTVRGRAQPRPRPPGEYDGGSRLHRSSRRQRMKPQPGSHHRVHIYHRGQKM